MPAYNPPAQVLFSPVTNYYQGKAIRTQQAMAEKELETYDQKMDLQSRRVAAQEKSAETQAGALEQRTAEWKAEIGDRNYKRLTLHAKGLVDTIDSQFGQSNKTPEDAEAALSSNIDLFSEYADAVSEVSPERGAELKEMLSDRIITPDEYRGFRELVNIAASEFTESKETAKMTEGRSMNLTPGTPEWSDWIRGEGEGNKPLAAEVKTQMVVDAMNGLYNGEKIDKKMADAILDANGVQRGVDGSVTINMETAQDMAESIIDRTHVGEGAWFTLQNNSDEFADRLAFSLMRLAKDGRFGGKELEERALADALGMDYDKLSEEAEIEDADGKKTSIMGMIKEYAKSIE